MQTLQKRRPRNLQVKRSSLNIITSWCFFPSPSSFPKNCICAAGPMKQISSQLNNSSDPITSSHLAPANKPIRPANGFSLTSAPQTPRSQSSTASSGPPPFPAKSPTSRKLIAISTNTTLSVHPKPGNPVPNVTSSGSCNIKTIANRVSLVSRQGFPRDLGFAASMPHCLRPCSVCSSSQPLKKHGNGGSSVSRV
ncbi:hypothetical protein N431DRAFT_555283 [Stipitochalara longipes BDJ]|nr:hypothetical protein N431DRAFT_555283 [Stipitochalara longipes BDJ]